MFLTKRKDGQVVSFSEERPTSVSDAHIVEEVDMTPVEVEEMKESKQVRIEKGQLKLTPQDVDPNPELKTLLDKMKNNTASKDDKDRALILLLEKSQS